MLSVLCTKDPLRISVASPLTTRARWLSVARKERSDCSVMPPREPRPSFLDWVRSTYSACVCEAMQTTKFSNCETYVAEMGHLVELKFIHIRTCTLLCVPYTPSGDPVIGVDVTEAGDYILATTKNYLLVIPTEIEGDAKQRTGFDVSYTHAHNAFFLHPPPSPPSPTPRISSYFPGNTFQ